MKCNVINDITTFVILHYIAGHTLNCPYFLRFAIRNHISKCIRIINSFSFFFFFFFFFGGGGGGGVLRSCVSCRVASRYTILCFAHLFVYLFCCFTSQVNNYGHGRTVSSSNHTFSWASLNRRLTSTSCTYFHL